MNFGDLVKLQQQQEKQPSTPTPTATITSTTQDPATALLVSGDATFALGLLDNSGGRDDDLGRQEQVSRQLGDVQAKLCFIEMMEIQLWSNSTTFGSC